MDNPITLGEILLEEYLIGQSDDFWHGLQVECDFRKLVRKKKRLTDGIRPASTLGQIKD